MKRNGKCLSRNKAIVVLALLCFSATISLSSVYAETVKKKPVYVGVDACKKCHAREYTSFMTHARKSRSFESIERMRKRLTEDEIKVCYSCHTTGYGKHGGFVSVEITPHLKIAGCEVCHGPGEFHAKTGNPRYIGKPTTVKDCETCHTEERVKAFRYKPLIHGGAH